MIRQRRSELGENFPRIGLFLFDCADSGALKQTLEQIPEPLLGCLEEIVLMQDGSQKAAPEGSPAPGEKARVNLRVHRSPRDYGYGGARKAAFEYALRQGFDHAIVMRAGLHPVQALPDLLHPVVCEGRQLVFGSRLARRRDAYRTGMPLGRLLGHAAATGFQNRVLGLRLRDYHSSFRVYSTQMLKCIPFELNDNDRLFDAQIVIQHRALGVAVHEIPVLPVWREDPTQGEELAHVLRACVGAVDYRLHQLHVTRRGKYFVDPGVHYTLKLSKTGSHMQIVSAIQPASRVLDLGCSQGLLARPLRENDVRVTGVDAAPAERRVGELDQYFQRDLEQPLELPTGRVFDYVVVADVIEHLRNRQQLLRGARRFLKENGRLIISTPNVALWFYRLSLLVGRFEYGPRGVLDRTHVHLFTRATFRREVERAGFFVLQERFTALPFEVVFRSTGRSRLIRTATRLYHLLSRAWPEMFAYQCIIEAEITTLDEESTGP